MVDKAIANRMMVPCYLNLDEYEMVKDMAEKDMRTMSGLLRVLIHREAQDLGISPEDYAEKAEQLRHKREEQYKEQ